jgi:SAM-dependent methyltransferase
VARVAAGFQTERASLPELSTYSDEEAAALYDVLYPWGPSDDFYLRLVMRASSVLDVGCGTGTLLHGARRSGHEGRLCGVDPDSARLRLAQRREDIEWIEGTAAGIEFDAEFELAVMTGHAFQVLVEDRDLRESLAAIRRALVHGGRFAFETRNPLVRAWESWSPEHAREVVDASGRRVRVWHEVESDAGDVVTFVETTGDPDGTPWRVDRTSLRFLEIDELGKFLEEADFVVEELFGGWSREPFVPNSREIVTIARAGRR